MNDDSYIERRHHDEVKKRYLSPIGRYWHFAYILSLVVICVVLLFLLSIVMG